MALRASSFATSTSSLIAAISSACSESALFTVHTKRREHVFVSGREAEAALKPQEKRQLKNKRRRLRYAINQLANRPQAAVVNPNQPALQEADIQQQPPGQD